MSDNNLTLNLLAAHVSIDAPHYKQSRFYNFPKDFGKLFDTPVSHADHHPRHLSALSPAAYLVDLLRLLENSILNHTLKDRRPDLWQLPLDQEHTEEQVPFLEIVNNVMATHLTKGDTDTEKPTEERRRVARKLLAEAQYPFDLPVHMPLLEIRTYLGHFGLSLADIFETLQLPVNGKEWVAETLGLSPSEFTTLTTPATKLAETYGLLPKADLAKLNDVATFLKQTGLTPNEFGELMQVAGLSVAEDKTSKQQSIEALKDERLDYLNRFIRLRKRLGWSFGDLHLVLGGTLTKDSLSQLAQVKTLCEKYKLPVDVLCSFSGPMNTTPGVAAGGKSAKKSLFDRVFNTPPFYHPPNEQRDPKTTPLSWNSQAHAGATADEKAKIGEAKAIDRGVRTSLLASLNIGNADLQAIVDHLCAKPAMEIDPAAIKLDVPTLTRFYRFSKMASVLGMQVPEYLALLKCIPKGTTAAEHQLTSPEVSTLKDLRTVSYWADWLKETGLSAYQIEYLTTGNLSDEARRRFDPGPSAEQLASFTFSAEQAQLTVKQLAETFHQDSRLVASALDFLKINVPGVDTKVTADQRKALPLLLYMSKALGLSTAVFDALLKNLALTGLPSPPTQPDTLRSVHTFSQLVKAFEKQGSGKEGTASRLATLDHLDPKDKDSAELSELSGWEAPQVRALLTFLGGKPASAVSRLAAMKRCFDLAAKLGVDIHMLIRLCQLPTETTEQFDGYSAAAHSLLSAVNAKYADDDWEKVFGPIRDQLNERERDALAALLLLEKKLDSLQDLSADLLIDVEMGGCARTSYILEAIGCLQTYIERCRMHLEKDVDLERDAIPDSLWSWMAHYRMWEANRRVFFYPENYLEPSQRKQATPLFKELQSELLQGDITDEAVTDAYINYFDKLDELASLKTIDGHIAMVKNPKTGADEETLFIIGRTSSEPPVFYLRNAVLDQTNQLFRAWTPWEKIDLTIPVPEVIALYARHRLYIFWIESKEMKETADPNPPTGPRTKRITKEATVKYSYQKVSGRWLQPQKYPDENKDLQATGPDDKTGPPLNNNILLPVPIPIGQPISNLEVLKEWTIKLRPSCWGGATVMEPQPDAQWQSLNTGWTTPNELKNPSVSSLAMTPDGRTLFAGTNRGVFRLSLTGQPGAQWQPFDPGWTTPNEELPSVFSLAMTPDGRTLFAGTYNDGVFGIAVTTRTSMISDDRDQFLVRSPISRKTLESGAAQAFGYTCQPLTTHAVHQLRQKLVTGGLDSLLSIPAQRTCQPPSGSSRVAHLGPAKGLEEKTYGSAGFRPRRSLRDLLPRDLLSHSVSHRRRAERQPAI